MSLLDDQPPHINPEQLSKLIGSARFEEIVKGLDQHKLSALETSKTSASAIINGHQVKVNFRPDTVEGACDCPESDGFEFCQHSVMLCLHTNRNSQQISSLSKGPDKSRVLAYLLSQDKQKLAKDFLDIISQDNELFERYLLRASLNQSALDYAQLKSQLTELTRKPEKLFSQRQVKHFFAKIDRYLHELALIDTYQEPDKMLKIVEHTHQRITRLLNAIDDNSEQRSDCVTTFRALHQKLMRQLSGREETKTKRYLKLWMSDAYNLLACEERDVLSDEAYEKFKALVNKAYQDKILKPKAGDTGLLAWQREKVLRCLLDLAIKNEDQDKIATLRQHLATQ